MSDPAARLQAALGYTFDDQVLLARALTHRSYLAEHAGGESNERLEFLGDAVLQLAVTHYLIGTYPGLAEGEMAKIRAAVVSETALAGIAAECGLGVALRLGRGEVVTGGREKASILSDALEAVLGALYVEAGFERAREVVLSHWTSLIEDRVKLPGGRDYKTRLQELLARDGDLPVYEVRDRGPDHEKVFAAVVRVGGQELGRGEGTSKKRAEQEAAQAAMERLARHA